MRRTRHVLAPMLLVLAPFLKAKPCSSIHQRPERIASGERETRVTLPARLIGDRIGGRLFSVHGKSSSRTNVAQKLRDR